jgi:hypothetical protein
MTEQELIDIKNTINYLIKEGDFKDAETSYNASMNSLNILEAAINYTQCCEMLKDKRVMTFDFWLEQNKYTQISDNLYKKEMTYYNNESLLKKYNTYLKNI